MSQRNDTSNEKEQGTSTSEESDFETRSETSDISQGGALSQSLIENGFREIESHSIDSSAEILKCLNHSISHLLPMENVGRGSDRTAIIRLNGELLRSKKSHWSVLDALVKSYSEIRELRLKEQKLNLALSSGSKSSTLFSCGSVVQSKVLATQLEFSKEELNRTKANLNELKLERGKLVGEHARLESDFKLISLENKRKNGELERMEISLKHVNMEIRKKSDRINELEDSVSVLEKDLRAEDREVVKLKEEKNLLQEAVCEQEKEIERMKSEVDDKSFQAESFEQQIAQLEKELRLSRDEIASKERLYGREERANLERRAKQMRKELQRLAGEREKNKEEINKLKQELQEWERYGARAAKEMNEYIDGTNKRQVEARQEIARYVTLLEQELQQAKAESLEADFPSTARGALEGAMSSYHSGPNVELRGSNCRIVDQQLNEQQPYIHQSNRQNSIISAASLSDETETDKKNLRRRSSTGRKLPDVSTASRSRSYTDSSSKKTPSCASQIDSELSESCVSSSADSPAEASSRKITRGSMRKLPAAPTDVVPKQAPKALPGVSSIYRNYGWPNTYYKKRLSAHDSGLGESMCSAVERNGFHGKQLIDKADLMFKERSLKDCAGAQQFQSSELMSYYRRLSTGERDSSQVMPSPPSTQPQNMASSSDSFRTVTPLSGNEWSSSPQGTSTEPELQGNGRRKSRAVYRRGIKWLKDRKSGKDR